jgi:hypothetical protein
MVREAENRRPSVPTPWTCRTSSSGAYCELSGTDVLCMDFLEGVEPSSEVVEAMTEERRHLVDLGATAIIRMLYEDGFFHADLHPGNLLVLPERKIGFIDLGMVGRIDPALRHNLMNLYHSLVMENFDSAARHLADVAHPERGADAVAFRRAVRELGRRWRRDASFETFAGAAISRATRPARRNLYSVDGPRGQALVTYEGVGYLPTASSTWPRCRPVISAASSATVLAAASVPRGKDTPGAPRRRDADPGAGRRVAALPEQQNRRQPVPLRGLRATVFGGFCLLSGAILVVFGGPWMVAAPLLILGLLLPLRAAMTATTRQSAATLSRRGVEPHPGLRRQRPEAQRAKPRATSDRRRWVHRRDRGGPALGTTDEASGRREESSEAGRQARASAAAGGGRCLLLVLVLGAMAG